MTRIRWRLKGPGAVLVDNTVPWERRMALLAFEDADLTRTTKILAAPEVADILGRQAQQYRRAADALSDVLAVFCSRLPTAAEQEQADAVIRLADAIKQHAEKKARQGREGRRGGGSAGGPVLARRDRSIQRWLHAIVTGALERAGREPAGAVCEALSDVLEPLPDVAVDDLLVVVRGALAGRARNADTRGRAVLDQLRSEVDASEWGIPRLAPLSARHWQRVLRD